MKLFMQKQTKNLAFCFFTFALAALFPFAVRAQQSTLKGILQDSKGDPIEFASVALMQSTDSVLVKAAVTNETGMFIFESIVAGSSIE